VVKPSYFSALAFARSFALALDLPLWAFTCSMPHWSYPRPTEDTSGSSSCLTWPTGRVVCSTSPTWATLPGA